MLIKKKLFCVIKTMPNMIMDYFTANNKNGENKKLQRCVKDMAILILIEFVINL